MMVVMYYGSFITFFWLIFFVTWIISAFGVKRDVTRHSSWWRFFIIRVCFIIFVAWLLNQSVFYNFWVNFNGVPLFANTTIRLIGTILCGAGIAFAIWARFHLGRNWSGSPQMKENHELVTSGPYRFVRHPIYTGMLAAIIGSVLASGPAWSVALVFVVVMIAVRIPKEEKFMMQLFPDQYPAYRARTKALIPFIW